MEYLVNTKRIVQDDIVLEVPYSRLRAMTNSANPLTLIEAQGESEIIIPTNVHLILIPSNETPLTFETPGEFFCYYSDSELASPFSENGDMSELVNRKYGEITQRELTQAFPAVETILNKALEMTYTGEIADSEADGILRIIVSYKVLEVL